MTAPLTDHERALCRDAVRRTLFEREREDRRSNVVDKDAWAERLYPDPAPEPKTVVFNCQQWRYSEERGDLEYRNHAHDAWNPGWITAADVRAFTSLLPKRELTDEIVRKAERMHWQNMLSSKQQMRAALLAVWDDIAAPALKPQWWGVVDRKGETFRCYDLAGARELVGVWDRRDPDSAPHRVVALAEVPQP